MLNREVYQEIFNELSRYLIQGWEKLIVYLEYGEASYSFFFYEKLNGKYIKCYDMPGVSDGELAISFQKIDSIVSKQRTKEKKPWSNMTMTVDPSGDMHTDFDYTDLSGGTYQFKKEWKKKYLL